MSTFMGLNTALRGVLAHQASLDVTGHNIANIDNKSYTRQRAEHVTSPQWSTAAYNSQVSPGQMGTGVEILRIERLRDQYIDNNARQQLNYQGTQKALVEQLARIEDAIQEPSEFGLSQAFRNYYAAMEQVAANPGPEGAGARTEFAAAANELALTFNRIDNDLSSVRSQADLRIDNTVNDINSIAQRIAELNREIGKAHSRGQQPNDVLDIRDQLLDDLSGLVNYTMTTDTLGQVTVTFAGSNIVEPSPTGAGFTAISRLDVNNAFTGNQLTSGQVFSDLQIANPVTGIIDTFRADLDALAATFINDMNAANADGFDLYGNPGAAIFAGSTAASIAIDPANSILIDPKLIAAASTWNGAGGEPGNGRNFEAILAGRNNDKAGLNNESYEKFFGNKLVALGAASKSAQKSLANAEALVEMALTRRDQVSGVSLDEEMSNMLRFQHAYNASARVMSTMDEMLDILINRMGRVGL